MAALIFAALLVMMAMPARSATPSGYDADCVAPGTLSAGSNVNLYPASMRVQAANIPKDATQVRKQGALASYVRSVANGTRCRRRPAGLAFPTFFALSSVWLGGSFLGGSLHGLLCQQEQHKAQAARSDPAKQLTGQSQAYDHTRCAQRPAPACLPDFKHTVVAQDCFVGLAAQITVAQNFRVTYFPTFKVSAT